MTDFVFSQPEAYEVKIGDRVYRRPGDPPLEEVIEMLQKEKAKEDSLDATVSGAHGRDEL
uniref:Uncharacterized protein n=1 Tax=Nymphaea colorata TaxID=210225 RepID=A0A5K0Y8E2_9MAGN|nr:unnamed protein product [Nymphaea colorata]